MYKFVTVISCVIILTFGAAAVADSLWTASAASMFTDLKAKQVGDLVTVLVSEASSSSLQASSDLSKGLDHSNQSGVGPFLKLLPEVSVKSGQKSSASGQTRTSSSLIARVTARVTKVLPNGNLEIEAQRTIISNAERQEITLTGVVRQNDIDAENTVLSTYISDVVVTCTGKGPVADRQKEGLLSRIVKYIF